MHDLQQLALIWASVFIASWLASKTKLTPVLYFLAAGCIMVNLGWLPTQSTPFITGISEVGIILIMFALGFEANPGSFCPQYQTQLGHCPVRCDSPVHRRLFLCAIFLGR